MGDYVLVGADASGLEMRCLAHYLAKHDGGAYAAIATEGDPHAENARVLGVDREKAKTFFYAWAYGAGDAKLGKIVGKSKKAGAELRGQFLGGIKGMPQLIEEVLQWHNLKGKVPLPAGYWARTRSDHSALNSLMQGTGAVVMKLATVLFHESCDILSYNRGAGLTGPKDYDYAQVHMSHDELQCEVKERWAEQIGQLMCDAIGDAGEQLNLRCPMAAEWKTGATWAETH